MNGVFGTFLTAATLRTWVKRLVRKTACFSKFEKMHDIVIGLLINKVEFGVDIHTQTHI